jgi:hypothetical protein
MADSFGVPVVAVVGEAFDAAAERLPTVSLVEHHGRERAMADTTACLTASAQLVLDAARRAR